MSSGVRRSRVLQTGGDAAVVHILGWKFFGLEEEIVL